MISRNFSNFHFPIQQPEGRKKEGGGGGFVLNRKGVPGFSGEQKFSRVPLFSPEKWKWKGGGGGVGCPRELRARGRYNIQGWGGRGGFLRQGNRAAHCIKVYHLRFFLIIIAFVDNGPGIICYREMSWSRNFLNYFGSPSPSFPNFSSSGRDSPLPPSPPFFLSFLFVLLGRGQGC